jgi:urea transport system ATP-binding protein
MMLAVAQLNQFYGGSHILRDLSFDVPAGKVTALLGRNGVGKTTLLRTLMGVIPAKTGSIRFGEKDLSATKPYERVRAGIGYVPQGREIFARLTVEENLRMGLATRPMGSEIPRASSRCSRCSSRCCGAAAAISRRPAAAARDRPRARAGPKLLILDEPTEGIQPSIIKDIERAIRTLAETGEMAILLVEQYYDFARSLAEPVPGDGARRDRPARRRRRHGQGRGARAARSVIYRRACRFAPRPVR